MFWKRKTKTGRPWWETLFDSGSKSSGGDVPIIDPGTPAEPHHGHAHDAGHAHDGASSHSCGSHSGSSHSCGGHSCGGHSCGGGGH